MWHDVKQNTDEPCPCCGKTWMDGMHPGKVTGSSIGDVMAYHDKPLVKKHRNGRIIKDDDGKPIVIGPQFGVSAKKLAVEIAVVELGGEATQNSYSNSQMERGHEQEPIARALYEAEYFCEVTNGGFYDNGRTGCSPDGHVAPNGMIEIKSVLSHIHYERIEKGGIDPKYNWQCRFNLKESGRDWIDFISFCATFPKKMNRLYVYRLEAKNLTKEFATIDARLAEFYELVESVKRRIRRAA